MNANNVTNRNHSEPTISLIYCFLFFKGENSHKTFTLPN